MKLKNLDQKGWTFWDVLFWAVIILALVWAVKQYILHPEGLNSRPVDHSGYEDKPK